MVNESTGDHLLNKKAKHQAEESTEGQLFEDNEEKLTRIKKCDQNVKKWNKLSAVNHLIAQQSLLHNGRMQIKSSGQLDP